MTILTLEVKLLFDDDPLDLEDIEFNVYDALWRAFQEGQITSEGEEATCTGIDSVEVQ